MLNTLLNIDKSGNVFLQDNAIVQAPKLWEVYKHKNMGSDMVRYIVWMFDNKSLYRQLPMEQRQKRVIRSIWGKDANKNKYLNHQLVKEAQYEYESLQYDPDIEAWNIMLEKSHEINEVYKNMKVTPDNIEDINILQEKMAKAAESRLKMLDIIKKTKDSDKKVFGKGTQGTMKKSLMEQKLEDTRK